MPTCGRGAFPGANIRAAGDFSPGNAAREEMVETSFKQGHAVFELVQSYRHTRLQEEAEHRDVFAGAAVSIAGSGGPGE